jgi:hypothetical protein
VRRGPTLQPSATCGHAPRWQGGCECAWVCHAGPPLPLPASRLLLTPPPSSPIRLGPGTIGATFAALLVIVDFFNAMEARCILTDSQLMFYCVLAFYVSLR